MNKLKCFIAAIACLALPAVGSAAQVMPTPGFNLGNTLESTWGYTPPTQALINSIADAGFKTLRVPCAWDFNSTNGTINAAFMQQVANVVDWALAKNMYVIINCHWDGGWFERHQFDTYDSNLNSKLTNIWIQVANRFQGYDSNRLSFACANEPDPANQTQTDVLYQYYQNWINAMRANGGGNAVRWLVIQAPSPWNWDILLNYGLNMPADPANKLMIEEHTYDPGEFAAQDSDQDWRSMKYFWGSGYHVTGNLATRNCTSQEESYLQAQFTRLKTNFVDRGYPVLIGEWAGQPKPTLPDLTGVYKDQNFRSVTYYNKYMENLISSFGFSGTYFAGQGDTFDATTGAIKNQDKLNSILGIAALPPIPGLTAPMVKLTGAVIGSSGSWSNSGNTITNAFDGNTNTFYDAANATGDWAGLDLGSGTNGVVMQIQYCPRVGWAGRMVGGQFQGANVADFSSGVVTLFTVASTPPEGTMTVQALTNASSFRYLRYIGPTNAFCDVAEVEFDAFYAVAPTSLMATGSNAMVSLSWNGSAGADNYIVKRSPISGSGYVTIASGLTATSFTDTGLVNGTTYYYVVAATNVYGVSPDSTEASATPMMKLNGAIIGSSGSWGNLGNTGTNVFDGNLNTFYDAVNSAGDWAGLDLGSGIVGVVMQINYCPRAGFASRMVGGQFQGANVANFSSGVVTLFTVASTPSEGTMTVQAVTNASSFRYLRYIGPAGGYCNAAEVEFGGAYAVIPPAPTGLAAVVGDAQVALNWNAASTATGYKIKRSLTSGSGYVNIATNASLAFTNTGLANGTLYYYVVSALNGAGESTNSTQVSARPTSSASVSMNAANAAGQLQISWPLDHTGWQLQSQTNNLTSGLGTNWVNLPASMQTNQMTVPLNSTNGSVFFRLVRPY